MLTQEHSYKSILHKTVDTGPRVLFHGYKASWSPYIGEELPVQREVNSIHNYFAVAVLKNSNTVDHVPREISRVCWYFLHKSGSEMTCIVNGDRRRSEVDGKILVVPCVYIFKGKQKHLVRLIKLFAKLTGSTIRTSNRLFYIKATKRTKHSLYSTRSQCN